MSGAQPCAGPSVVRILPVPTAVSETVNLGTTLALRAPVTVRPLPRDEFQELVPLGTACLTDLGEGKGSPAVILFLSQPQK